MTKIIDLNTTEGIAAYVRTLPTENLRTIAARMTIPTSEVMIQAVLIETACAAELILRETAEPALCYHREHCGATEAEPCTATPGPAGTRARRKAAR